MTHRTRLLATLTVSAAVLLSACGSSSPKASTTTTTSAAPTTAATAATTTAPAVTGKLNVLAASSLTAAFGDEKTALATADPNLSLTYDFAGSQMLVQQIQQGAPADVFASADMKHMQTLVSAGLVETPTVLADNRLEIVTAAGNPKGVKSLADLSRSDLVLVLADPSVPAGNYAAQILAKAGVTVKPKSLELNVKAVINDVISGEADAAIVYVTDVEAAGSKVTGVPIPDAQNAIAQYPIAVLKASKNQAAAKAFIASLVSPAGQKLLQGRGFLPPT